MHFETNFPLGTVKLSLKVKVANSKNIRTADGSDIENLHHTTK